MGLGPAAARNAQNRGIGLPAGIAQLAVDQRPGLGLVQRYGPGGLGDGRPWVGLGHPWGRSGRLAQGLQLLVEVGFKPFTLGLFGLRQLLPALAVLGLGIGGGLGLQALQPLR